MRTDDIRDLGRLTGEALAAGAELIGETHRGIASRPFGILGRAAAPVRIIHDTIADAVYTGVRAGLGGLARGAAEVAAARLAAERLIGGGREQGEGPGAAVALGILNGFHGDYLERSGSSLALPMTIRRYGRSVPVNPGSLRESFPDAGHRLVVFLHGLCETELDWWTPPLSSRAIPRRSYGDRLQQELDLTPVYLRYNTGRHISDNGRALARLLESLIDAWPRPVEELTLVGHSMGGLVARSACHYGERDRLRFADKIAHVFCLGSPHLGADLEKGANALAWALRRLPETRALARVINARSIGIKDLRYGACVEEDWQGHNPDEFLRDRCTEVPFLPRAMYYFVGATLREGPLGNLLGDLLVRSPSASGRGSGRGRSIPFEVDKGLELSGLTHFDLLNHPAVFDQLRRWLATTPRRPTRALAPACSA